MPEHNRFIHPLEIERAVHRISRNIYPGSVCMGWVAIEREAKVTRRIAKREYESWETRESRAELNQARVMVAAEDLRNHMDCLVRVAQTLAGGLRVPSYTGASLSAEDLMERLWEHPICAESGAANISSASQSNIEITFGLPLKAEPIRDIVFIVPRLEQPSNANSIY